MNRSTVTPAIVFLATTTACLQGAPTTPAHADTPLPQNRYYEELCTDLDNDRVDDYFGNIQVNTLVDVMLVFDADTYVPEEAEAAVRAALNDPTGAYIRYVSTYSPYIFVHGITLQHPVASTPDISRLLAIGDVRLVKPYQRFRLVTNQVPSSSGGSGDGWIPENSGGGDLPGDPPASGAPRGGLSGLAVAAPTGGAPPGGPLPGYIQPQDPDVLIYFVDSGLDGETYWATDAVTDDPLHPEETTNPFDITGMKHGSFLAALTGGTIEAARATQGGAGAIAFADVKVAVAPGGETTTLELTRALDAIKSHLLYEKARGQHFRAVINISYDTDGGIANHDIIYPNPGRRPPLDPKGVTSPLGDGPPVENDIDPCDHVLFDMVYGDVSRNHDTVVCVGAGNDGERAAYILNEVGQSASTTIVATALNGKGSAPAEYSNFGRAPLGTNGHPDLAAPGLSGAPEFEYKLEGTSVATAYTSAMAAVTLSRRPDLKPADVRQELTLAGTPLAPVGDRLYGRAKLALPWKYKTVARLGPNNAIDFAASPNPFRPATRLHFSVPQAGAVTVELFDVQGRRVRRLHAGVLPAGAHALPFDGRGDDGRLLATGLYFGRVEAPGGTGVTRVIIDR